MATRLLILGHFRSPTTDGTRKSPGGWPAQKTKGWRWTAGVAETSQQGSLSTLPDPYAPLIGYVLDMHYIAAVQVMQVLKPT